MSIAMNEIVVEGYKKTRKIVIKPSETGLTLLSGDNKQGKTSVLDAICHGLIGPTYVDRMTEVINRNAKKIEGAYGARARVTFELSDGTKIVRRFTDKNSRSGILEVTLPDGVEGSQENINEFFSSAALRLPNMDAMSERDRLKYLLGGLGIDISDLELKYSEATKEKEVEYQNKEQARRAFDDLPEYPEAPQTEVSLSKLTKEFEEAVEHNKTCENAAEELSRIKASYADIEENIHEWNRQIVKLQHKIKEAQNQANELVISRKRLENTIVGHQLIDTDDIRARMDSVEQINNMVRANLMKREKEEEVTDTLGKWRNACLKQESALAEMAQRIKGADVPMDAIGVSFVKNTWIVTFDSSPWANMSGMQQIMFNTAVASLYNKNARLVLVDGLESLDDNMKETFNAWLIERGLQSIATCVGNAPNGNFVKLLIADGEVKG